MSATPTPDPGTPVTDPSLDQLRHMDAPKDSSPLNFLVPKLRAAGVAELAAVAVLFLLAEVADVHLDEAEVVVVSGIVVSLVGKVAGYFKRGLA